MSARQKSVIAAINPVVGGGGGMPHRDGTNGSGADSAYLKNTPIEINETEVPVRFLRYGLLPDSGGAGRWRGGLATVLEFQVFAPDTRITVRNRDRCRFRPWGTLGGKAAEPSDFILNPGTHARENPRQRRYPRRPSPETSSTSIRPAVVGAARRSIASRSASSLMWSAATYRSRRPPRSTVS